MHLCHSVHFYLLNLRRQRHGDHTVIRIEDEEGKFMLILAGEKQINPISNRH